jgi:glycosyltransferase involved in cell wall biosynthesis
MKVSVIVPVLYTEPQLAGTLERLASLKEGLDLDVLVIVDVPDPAREAEARARNDPLTFRFGARTRYRVGQRGFGSALRFGFTQAAGDAMIPFMGDCSDRPEDIPRMVQALERGNDVVVGSRYMRGGGIVGNTAKQRFSRLYSIVVRAVGGPAIHDVSNAFKAYRREVIQAVETTAESFDISVELTVRAAAAGFRIGEIPTVWTNREMGASNFHVGKELRNYWRWLWFAARARRRSRPASPAEPAPAEGEGLS